MAKAGTQKRPGRAVRVAWPSSYPGCHFCCSGPVQTPSIRCKPGFDSISNSQCDTRAGSSSHSPSPSQGLPWSSDIPSCWWNLHTELTQEPLALQIPVPALWSLCPCCSPNGMDSAPSCPSVRAAACDSTEPASPPFCVFQDHNSPCPPSRTPFCVCSAHCSSSPED